MANAFSAFHLRDQVTCIRELGFSHQQFFLQICTKLNLPYYVTSTLSRHLLIWSRYAWGLNRCRTFLTVMNVVKTYIGLGDFFVFFSRRKS